MQDFESEINQEHNSELDKFNLELQEDDKKRF